MATETGVYAGGYFDQTGPVRVASVAQWRDDAWHDLAGGVQSPHVLGEVFAMLAVGSDLLVTGQFETAGGVAAGSIARWEGEQWHDLGGSRSIGYALTVLGDRFYVGGGFSLAGDVRVSNDAAWDPATGTWSPVGSVPTYDGDIFSLAVVDDRYLVIGGEFSKLWAGRFQVSGPKASSRSTRTPRPSRPTHGQAAPDFQGSPCRGCPKAVSALEVLGNDVHVGGAFDTAGVESFANPPDAGFPAANLAIWHFLASTDTWSAPSGTNRQVKAFATLDGCSLVIGGGFGSAGGVEAAAVAEHDPATGSWSAYGSGIGWGARGIRQVKAPAQGQARDCGSAESSPWLAACRAAGWPCGATRRVARSEGLQSPNGGGRGRSVPVEHCCGGSACTRMRVWWLHTCGADPRWSILSPWTMHQGLP